MANYYDAEKIMTLIKYSVDEYIVYDTYFLHKGNIVDNYTRILRDLCT